MPSCVKQIKKHHENYAGRHKASPFHRKNITHEQYQASEKLDFIETFDEETFLFVRFAFLFLFQLLYHDSYRQNRQDSHNDFGKEHV
jgi:hypothetical protein